MMKLVKRYMPVLSIVFVSIVTSMINLTRLDIYKQPVITPDVIGVSIALVFALTWLIASCAYGVRREYIYVISSSFYFIVQFIGSQFGLNWSIFAFLEWPLLGLKEPFYHILKYLCKGHDFSAYYGYVVAFILLLFLNVLVFFISLIIKAKKQNKKLINAKL